MTAIMVFFTELTVVSCVIGLVGMLVLITDRVGRRTGNSTPGTEDGGKEVSSLICVTGLEEVNASL